MDPDSLLLLTAGRLELALAPAMGGCIARFDCCAVSGGKTRILRGVEGVPTAILDAASFPLVPFCNRVRGGTFRFRNRKVTLAQNLHGEPSPLHGQGWTAAWETAARGERDAELRFLHPAGAWPWRYQAVQHFRLDPGGLSVDLDCTNLSDEPMPCGLGQHPYFPCTPQTRLQTEVACAWTVDEQVLPVERVPAQGRYDLADRAVCGQGLDNGFGGWSGRARIATPGAPFAVELSSPDARFFHLYSPAAGGAIAAEPATHANAALNAPEAEWAALGLRVLAPGETMTLRMRIGLVFDQ